LGLSSKYFPPEIQEQAHPYTAMICSAVL